MKLNQKSLLASLALGTALILSATSGAQAAVTITIAPSGANVVATGSGTLDLTGLSFEFDTPRRSRVEGAFGNVITGIPELIVISVYSGITGPSSFGDGARINANSGSGDMFGVSADSIITPFGYVSKAPLSGTSTWDNTTISGLGLTPGTYVYNWGTGPTADSLTVQIVPEPSHALLALGGLGALALRRRR